MIDKSTSMIERALAALVQGAPVIFPTDTVYGVGVAALFAPTPRPLFKLKCRRSDKPIAWLIEDQDDLIVYGKNISETAFRLAQRFWPGPLTLVVGASSGVPEGYRSLQGTIALRVPANKTACRLMQEGKSPLATSSANLSGSDPPLKFEDIPAVLLDNVAVSVRNDSQVQGVVSTVVDCTRKPHVVLREGAITASELKVFCEKQSSDGIIVVSSEC